MSKIQKASSPLSGPASNQDDHARRCRLSEATQQECLSVCYKGRSEIRHEGTSLSTSDAICTVLTHTRPHHSQKVNLACSLASARREANVLTSCDHFNLVKCHGCKSEGEWLKLTLEYVQGGTVKSAMTRSKRQTLREVMPEFAQDHLALDVLLAIFICSHCAIPRQGVAAVVLADLLAGLKYLHDKGGMHRNVRAENLLLTGDGHVKLAGFGSSKANEAGKRKKHRQTMMAGSRLWRAPEVSGRGSNGAKMGSYDCKVDIWSVGMTALELVMGCPPPEPLDPAGEPLVVLQVCYVYGGTALFAVSCNVFFWHSLQRRVVSRRVVS